MDDKKKLIVLAALAVAVVAIGAFQFTGGSEEAPQAEKPKEEQPVAQNAAEEVPTGPLNPTFANDLSPRDPFLPGSLPGMQLATNTTTPAPQPRPTPPPRNFEPPRNLGGQVAPFQVPGLPDGSAQGLALVPEEDRFGYSLVGIIVGDPSAAVFADEAGNQRLITLGGSLDGDSRVIGITRGKVTVRHKGKSMNLTLGGTASAK